MAPPSAVNFVVSGAPACGRSRGYVNRRGSHARTFTMPCALPPRKAAARSTRTPVQATLMETLGAMRESLPVSPVPAVQTYDVLLLTLIVAVATLWLSILGRLSSARKVPSVVSRKLVHISCGPFYVLMWPFFSNTSSARYVAAMVPFIMSVRVLAAGSGRLRDSLTQTISRSGLEAEILSGPLFYTLALLLATLFFWRTPAGVLCVMQMSAGDGVAELTGRAFGEVSGKWPFNRKKSLAGSMGFVVAAYTSSVAVTVLYKRLGVFASPISTYYLPIAIISAVCAMVEVVDQLSDNITVPLVAAGLASFLL